MWYTLLDTVYTCILYMYMYTVHVHVYMCEYMNLCINNCMFTLYVNLMIVHMYMYIAYLPIFELLQRGFLVEIILLDLG